MAYGTIYSDTIQGSTANTAPVFNDGNSRETGKLCRSWSDFDGSASTIKASFNVSSLTKNATGQWYINMTTAMLDANYNCVAGSGYQISNFSTGFVSTFPSSTSSQAIAKYASGFQDEYFVHSNVFR